jgi:hypothetical protein
MSRPLYIYYSVLLNFSCKKCLIQEFRKNQNEHFMFNYIFLKILLLYETAWKNVELDRPQMAI